MTEEYAMSLTCLARLSLLSILMPLLMVTAAEAATTYTYTGNNFTSVSNLFTTSDSMFISITTSTPIPANSSNYDATGIVTSFSFSNGVGTVTDSTATGTLFRFSTDGTGAITDWAVLAGDVSGGGSLSCQLGTTIMIIVDDAACAPGGLVGGTAHVDFGLHIDPASSQASVVDSPGPWTGGGISASVPSLQIPAVMVLLGLLGSMGFVLLRAESSWADSF